MEYAKIWQKTGDGGARLNVPGPKPGGLAPSGVQIPLPPP